MNKQSCDILHALSCHRYTTQRDLAAITGYSLGSINLSLKQLIMQGYLTEDFQLTTQATKLLLSGKPKNAIILAAGFGMRMVPINTQYPKGLLQVKSEPLIERLIRQLHQVNVRNIYVVVGFMKESYEYLIDQYGVELIVNPDYATSNNLHSLALAADHIGDSYILPCDLWCQDNPFSTAELYPWYMVSNETDQDSTVKCTRTGQLVKTTKSGQGNRMLGISYIPTSHARQIRQTLLQQDARPENHDLFWEDALLLANVALPEARVVSAGQVIEINTYEQLRNLDSDSDHLQSDVIQTICQSLKADPGDITQITVLKKGMTNRSFLFTCRGKKYIMRVPGEGTDQLINRQEEAQVYQTIRNFGICDDIVHIDPVTGYKITAFLENARVCNPDDPEDLRLCMQKLRQFHNMKLQVSHSFPLFEHIDFYESLWNGASSVYTDYKTTKKNVFSLQDYINKHRLEPVLTHIDAVPDNFLFALDKQGNQQIRLIDWEYAGLQDPHVDVAMFCIYALYDRAQVDRLIDLYFTEGCDLCTRVKIYCYIAVCGLLWSNWCEYKRQLGVEFGEYSLRQYRYAKDYFRLAQQIIKEEGL